MSWLNDTLKGALFSVVGGALCVTGVGVIIGAPLLVTGAYTAGKAQIRVVREFKDEEDGQMFIVYYDHEKNKQFLTFMGSALPEIPLVDLYAGANNTKIAHAKAWFTMGSKSYITIEITFGA